MKEFAIIPGINEPSFEEVKRKIKLVQEVTNLVHIDVTDEKFVEFKTFTELKDLFEIDSPTNLELHLMVNDPRNYIPENNHLVKKLIVHVESPYFDRILLEDLRNKGFFVCPALKVETDFEAVEPFLELSDCVMFMGVELGPKGQQLHEEVVNKIRNFRKKFPDMPIEIDGGVHESTIKMLRQAGVDYFVAVSEAFKDDNVEENILTLEELVDYAN